MFFAGKPEKTGHFYLFAAACVFFLRRFFACMILGPHCKYYLQYQGKWLKLSKCIVRNLNSGTRKGKKKTQLQ